jgi:hypothetical protein
MGKSKTLIERLLEARKRDKNLYNFLTEIRMCHLGIGSMANKESLHNLINGINYFDTDGEHK